MIVALAAFFFGVPKFNSTVLCEKLRLVAFCRLTYFNAVVSYKALELDINKSSMRSCLFIFSSYLTRESVPIYWFIAGFTISEKKWKLIISLTEEKYLLNFTIKIIFCKEKILCTKWCRRTPRDTNSFEGCQTKTIRNWPHSMGAALSIQSELFKR